MKRITLPNILRSLRELEPQVEIDPAVADRARRAVERMLAVAAEPAGLTHIASTRSAGQRRRRRLRRRRPCLRARPGTDAGLLLTKTRSPASGSSVWPRAASPRRRRR